MNNDEKYKLSVILSIFFGLILIITAINSIIAKQWNNLGLSLLASIGLAIPFIISFIAKVKKISLPNNFKSVTLLFIFSAQYLGEILNFYDNFWWWDLLLHGVFGSYAVIVGMNFLRGIIRMESEISEKRFLTFKSIFAFNFSITLGTLWEMFEYVGDFFFNTHMVTGGLDDTASDLLIKIFTAFITSAIYYFHSKNMPGKI